MAVEIKYVVIRDGEEKMSFASKKEADAWDKMLDLAEVLGNWLTHAPVALEDTQREMLSLWLAEQRNALSAILKHGRADDNSVQRTPPASVKKEKAGRHEDETGSCAPETDKAA